MTGKLDQTGTARPRRRKRKWVALAVVVIAVLLGLYGISLARMHLFPPAVAGVQATHAAQSAPGDVVLSQAAVSPPGAVEFGQDIVFTVQAAPSGASDEVVVLLGDPPVEVAHLNDIGWPPDEHSLDGVWSGRLDWPAVTQTGANLPLRFEYRRGSKMAAQLDFGTLSLTESQVGIRAFNCVPAGEVTVNDDLRLTADLGVADLPGAVVAVIGDVAEVALYDDGREPDECPRDGIYSAKLPVPISLTYNAACATRAEYRDSAGNTVASFAGPDVILQAPEVYLTDFNYSPAGEPLEIGAALTVRALLNRSDKQVKINVAVTRDGTILRGMPTTLDGYVLQDGRREFAGQWEDQLTWPHELVEPGNDYYLVATLSDGGRLVSRREAGPLAFSRPEITITEYRFDPPPPLEFGRPIGIQAHTNKATNAGALQLVIDGYPHCRLVDDGSSHSEDSVRWWDEVRQDGEWVGLLKWYYNPHHLEAGSNYPARLEYVLGETVLATYELPPLAILPLDITIESFYREPAGPVKLGSDLRFIIDLNRPVSLGQIKVVLADGTQLAWETDVDGDRITLEMNWKELTQPGDYGPVLARYYLNPNTLISECEDTPLQVTR